jgi:ketosteroid isomerase-like protein
MKQIMIALIMACTATTSAAFCFDDSEETRREIESLLATQDAFWNAEDIEGFMQTYWKSDALTFSGGGKTTRGWQATLDRYRKGYPKGQMGQLHFDQLETTLLGDKVALVLGRWYLDNQGEKKEGNFSLVMKKFDEGWKIVHDHSSTLELEKGWLTVAQAEQVAKTILGTDKVKILKLDHYLAVTPTADENRKIYVDRKTAEVSSEQPAELGGQGANGQEK